VKSPCSPQTVGCAELDDAVVEVPDTIVILLVVVGAKLVENVVGIADAELREELPELLGLLELAELLEPLELDELLGLAGLFELVELLELLGLDELLGLAGLSELVELFGLAKLLELADVIEEVAPLRTDELEETLVGELPVTVVGTLLSVSVDETKDELLGIVEFGNKGLLDWEAADEDEMNDAVGVDGRELPEPVGDAREELAGMLDVVERVALLEGLVEGNLLVSLAVKDEALLDSMSLVDDELLERVTVTNTTLFDSDKEAREEPLVAIKAVELEVLALLEVGDEGLVGCAEAVTEGLLDSNAVAEVELNGSDVEVSTVELPELVDVASKELLEPRTGSTEEPVLPDCIEIDPEG
jgi:hypothetical protein